jgi:hypothetical protein
MLFSFILGSSVELGYDAHKMRALEGVFALTPNNIGELKRHALLFDKFHVLEFYDGVDPKVDDPQPPHARADLNFLKASGIVANHTGEFINDAMAKSYVVTERADSFRYSESFLLGDEGQKDEGPRFDPVTGGRIVRAPFSNHDELLSDYIVRRLSVGINQLLKFETVPICQRYLPATLRPPELSSADDVLHVALQALPVPDDSCAWQDILDFRTEMHDKEWGFRRWLQSLAKKKQTEAEIRDEIEWLVNEYSKAMELHRIKASQSFVDVFVISPLEIIENLVKFSWSKIAKGALQVQKRKVELLEAEMKAPGRECAYVFDARKRFGT